MADLVRVVEKVKAMLKEEYLKDTTAIWHVPQVAFFKGGDDPKFLDPYADPEKMMGWLRGNAGARNIDGIIVGRMVAKFSKTIKDSDGNPMVIEKAILVTGHALDSKQTYVSITPCKEHADLRRPQHDEPNPEKLPNPAITSPDKVQPILDDEGGIKGFRELQFGDEIIFDSRRGERCMVDPVIEGVTSTIRTEG